jgi:hypothetical protein
VKRQLQDVRRDDLVPDDLAYVYNPKFPDKPRLLRFPAGNGMKLSVTSSPQSSFHDLLEIGQGDATAARIQRTERDGYAHNAFTFTPGLDAVITGGGSGWLRRYDPAGRHQTDYTGHTGDVWALAVSPDGQYLASGSDDQTVRLWNARTGELLASLFHALNGEWVMWTPQGYFNASPNGDELIGWHINKGPGRAAEFVTAAQLRQHFYRPHIVDQAIGLASAEKAVTRAANTGFSFDRLTTHAPPAFRIEDIRPTVEAGRVRLRLDLDIAPAEEPARSLAILVNGRNTASVSAGLPPAAGGRFTTVIPGAPGRNLVEISLANDTGVTTRRIAVEAPQLPGNTAGKLFILSVGVNRYRALDQDLRFAADDARAIHDGFSTFAGRLHSNVTAQLLADTSPQAPTAANISEALKVLAGAGPRDTVIVFLAGHGINQGPDYLFLPANAHFAGGRWQPDTVIDWQVLHSALAGAKGRRILVVDTCHAGNAFNPRLIKDAEDANITIFAATDADTLAHEQAALGHGVFTHALMAGLKGRADTDRNAKIEASEIARYVRQEVTTLTNGRQRPVTHLPVSGDFPLSVY